MPDRLTQPAEVRKRPKQGLLHRLMRRHGFLDTTLFACGLMIAAAGELTGIVWPLLAGFALFVLADIIVLAAERDAG